MHRQTDEQSSRSEKWQKFSGSVENATIGEQCFRTTSRQVFMETTDEHKVLRPIRRAKINESHTVSRKSVAWKNWSCPASWRGGREPQLAMSPEKWRESRVQRSSTKTEMLFLWCFSAPCCERVFQQLPEHTAHIRPNDTWKRMELITPTKKGWIAKMSTTAVLLLESLRSPLIEHLKSITTPPE